MRKLTDTQVAEILERREKGEAYIQIAASYGVSGSRIYELTHPEKEPGRKAKAKARKAARVKVVPAAEV